MKIKLNFDELENFLKKALELQSYFDENNSDDFFIDCSQSQKDNLWDLSNKTLSLFQEIQKKIEYSEIKQEATKIL